MNTFAFENIKDLRKKLSSHKVYSSIKSTKQLSVFMQHHVFSVWDFMSLVKYLQNALAPATTPWLPSQNSDVQRFINDIVLKEESDEAMTSKNDHTQYTSHFNLYADAMEEVEKNSSNLIRTFINKVSSQGLNEAMQSLPIPKPSLIFMQSTFEFLNSNKPHIVAAAFALGREHIIPEMFQALLEKMNIKKEQAEVFHYYLERHIELDGDEHGPMAIKMLELLCENDPIKLEEALEAAKNAIQARILFWDGVLEAINNKENI